MKFLSRKAGPWPGSALGVAGHTHEAKFSSAVMKRESVHIEQRGVGALQGRGFLHEALVVTNVIHIVSLFLKGGDSSVTSLSGADLLFQFSLRSFERGKCRQQSGSS